MANSQLLPKATSKLSSWISPRGVQASELHQKGGGGGEEQSQTLLINFRLIK